MFRCDYVIDRYYLRRAASGVLGSCTALLLWGLPPEQNVTARINNAIDTSPRRGDTMEEPHGICPQSESGGRAATTPPHGTSEATAPEWAGATISHDCDTL